MIKICRQKSTLLRFVVLGDKFHIFVRESRKYAILRHCPDDDGLSLSFSTAYAFFFGNIYLYIFLSLYNIYNSIYILKGVMTISTVEYMDISNRGRSQKLFSKTCKGMLKIRPK